MSYDPEAMHSGDTHEPRHATPGLAATHTHTHTHTHRRTRVRGPRAAFGVWRGTRALGAVVVRPGAAARVGDRDDVAVVRPGSQLARLGHLVRPSAAEPHHIYIYLYIHICMYMYIHIYLIYF